MTVTHLLLTHPDRRSAHALVVFLVLTFAVTWAVWVPWALESTGVLDSRWATDVGAVYAYGPAIAAVLTAAEAGRPALQDLVPG
jgi:hypothetical protein